MDYEPVIGLETHVQLRTRSKMWCGCPNEFGSPPNVNVCPICLGLPGVLPVANEEAIRLTIRTGLLLHCEIPRHARFDRKNYFYPDMAKNYQITQYDQPSTRHGFVDFEFEGGIARVGITRAHLEEDVAKNTHFSRESGVDFNRAGVPLLEIVSEPDLRSAEMAHTYLNALTEILVHGGISDCDMEKGMVRCDVNVSVRPRGQEALGAKIEIKNMNTFSGVRRALDHEIPRQIAVLRKGESLPQETRRWNDDAGITEPMRSKEDAHDYRYLPDPDLLPLEPSESWLAEIREPLPELPLARKERFRRVYGLPAGDAEVFKANIPLGTFFEQAAIGAANPRTLGNWVINNLAARLNETRLGLENLKFPPAAFRDLVALVDAGTISSRIAQGVFDEMFISGQSAAAIVAEKGLAQVNDPSAIEALCERAMAANPGPVGDFRAGKHAALNFLKGQVLKLSQGKANPTLVGEVLERMLRQ